MHMAMFTQPGLHSEQGIGPALPAKRPAHAQGSINPPTCILLFGVNLSSSAGTYKSPAANLEVFSCVVVLFVFNYYCYCYYFCVKQHRWDKSVFTSHFF